ncbi:TPA: N-6 DNA methylase [Vibrio parahaemolyticus]|uniref:site-specific DNA-methyltransferase (adenine-specific) n=1 Tax=Vibrio parahaemolyticus TaxID=670 RepID=A0A227JIH0_VIBPH|nr:N-6 DNA methylase [Vibrio parahaemolyticus]EGR0402556.1 adenine methyltransferase [Vibrio parahaemolyticus]ELJ8800136.1 N-6 DNA methylase [Vibrio parahaemolyticus]ETX23646.1 type IIS restriction enzyme Eco57I [Vibrio parahaemolyticus IDH02640]OXE34860.1 adenine methyltransferase [Vibrio parahaemolyticus]HAS6842010.1 N-6 DNA methylase [Vibrio parahaemolyticus]
MTKKKLLQALVDKYQKDIDFYRSAKYNETQLRTDFLDQLFSILGWDITNAAGKPTNEREVLVEEGLKAKAGENTKKPDYTFRLFSERKFFLEAKKPNVNVSTAIEPALQVRRYGFTAKLKISVLSNFEYTAIYDCSNPVKETDTVANSRIKLYHFTELVDNFDEINKLVGRESVYTGQFDNEWLEIENKILKFSVDDLFLKQINDWRLRLASEFLQIKKELSEEELNDLVQNYINSIVFLRVCEDRDLEDYETLYHFAQAKDFHSLVNKLKSSDKKYNSGLFALAYIDELINNADSCIWSIIEQLYFPHSTYSFSVFSSDILGNIYEIFLSEKVRVDEFGNVKIQPKEEHIDRDVVTTPTHIVKEIIRNTVVEYCKDKSDVEILNSKFADIACGSGAFIIEVFQSLQDILVDYYLKNDKSKLQQLSEHTYKLKLQVKKEILCKCIYGIDKDYNATKACAFGLLLKLLEGESKETIGNTTPILPALDGNILFGNSLIDSKDKVKQEDVCAINPFDLLDHQFDVIVGNPPYMATEHMNQLIPKEFEIYKNKYKSAFKQFDKYFLFVERSMQALKQDGYLGYILPSKFIKVGSGKNLRKLLSDNKYLSKFISFGSYQVFQNKTTYTCLLFLNKADHDDFSFYEVKDFKKWLTREDKSLLSSTYQTSSLDSDTWVLEKKTNDILNLMSSKSKPLGDIVGKTNVANGIQTSANKYYIHKEIKTENGFVYFKYDGVVYHIEKELTRPYFETNRNGEDSFYTYKDLEPNSFVVYPYKKVGNKIQFIEYDELKLHYPKLFDFLHVVKVHLNHKKRSIKPYPTGPNEWYRYGRSQALENCDVDQKLIVGVLSNGYKYSIDNHRTFVSSGGTAGYSIINVPNDVKYSIYYIQAVLTSKYLEWFASIYGEIFRGGFVARGTKVQMRMPIPTIDFDDPKEKATHDKISLQQQSLNRLYGQIQKAGDREKIILERQFEQEKAKMDDLIKDLYDLGDLDSEIPTVEDLYKNL